MEKIAGVYYIVNKINGKFYIGSSWSIYRRWKAHRTTYRRGDGNNAHLQAAWNKYGEDNFEFKLVKQCSDEDVYKEEQLQLDEHYGKDYCYNLDSVARRDINSRYKSSVSRKQTDVEKAKRSESIKKTMSSWTKEKRESVNKKLSEVKKSISRERYKEIAEKARITNGGVYFKNPRWKKDGENFHVNEAGRLKAQRSSEEFRKSEEGQEMFRKLHDLHRKNWKDPEYRADGVKRLTEAAKKRSLTNGMTKKEQKHYYYVRFRDKQKAMKLPDNQ